MKRNLMPLDLVNLPDSEEAIDHYLRQLMEEGGAAKVARARLHIEKAQARNKAQINPQITAPVPAPPPCYPLPFAAKSPATPAPAQGTAPPWRCCG